MYLHVLSFIILSTSDIAFLAFFNFRYRTHIPYDLIWKLIETSVAKLETDSKCLSAQNRYCKET